MKALISAPTDVKVVTAVGREGYEKYTHEDSQPGPERTLPRRQSRNLGAGTSAGTKQLSYRCSLQASARRANAESTLVVQLFRCDFTLLAAGGYFLAERALIPNAEALRPKATSFMKVYLMQALKASTEAAGAQHTSTEKRPREMISNV